MFWTSILSFKFNPNRIYHPGPTKFFRRRRILRISAHYHGRRQNCYVLALKTVQKALQYSVLGRKLKHKDIAKLNAFRTKAGAEEIGLNYDVMRRGLDSARICLDNRALSTLAIWEPRTFKALGNFAWNNFSSKGFSDIRKLGPPPEGVILRGMKK